MEAKEKPVGGVRKPTGNDKAGEPPSIESISYRLPFGQAVPFVAYEKVAGGAKGLVRIGQEVCPKFDKSNYSKAKKPDETGVTLYKAVGRALAMLGYGTQFAPELDEGDRIVDSPIPAKPDPERAQYLKAIAASGIDARLIDASCMKRYKKPLEKLTTEQLAEVAVLMAQSGADNAGA